MARKYYGYSDCRSKAEVPTKKEFEDKAKNLENELADLGGKAILEVGEKYIKYANGIVEQWGRCRSGSQGFATIEFPVKFENEQYDLQITPEYRNETGPFFAFAQRNPGGEKAYAYTRKADTSILANADVLWRAIGRWK